MTPDGDTGRRAWSGRGWWLATGLLGAAVGVDLYAGNPLKLASSVFLFLGCLLAALMPVPRPAWARILIVGCFVAALLILIQRLFVTGL